ncbi:MAG: cytochrome c biogenesis protein CcsA [bacterium]
MNSSVPGDILVLMAFAFNLVAGLAFWAAARGRDTFASLGRRAYHAQTAVILAASGYLLYLFMTHDFGIAYVYQYSDSTLPFFYLLSAFWGGQEGTYLLWLLFILAAGNAVLYRSGKYRDYAMSVLSLVNLFFLFILLKLSPFARLDFPALDGAGLNPLLQDPWMVIHPPVMFTGYAMAAIPFAIVCGALLKGDMSDWLKRAFPWVAFSALALSAGNILGGYWAYKTLGWGGYWAWDPVENSSFVPWLASLAALHGMIIQRRSGALHKSNILMVCFLFLLVVYGTFLTRSGVLADFSVHSFVDLGTNIYLVAFLLTTLVVSVALFFWRALGVESKPLNYNFWGREFSLLAAMVLLFIMAVVVLFWTSLPVLSSVFSDEPRAADIATYNSFALPLAILMAFLVAVAPWTAFTVAAVRRWRLRLTIVVIVAIGIGFVGIYLWADGSLVSAVTFVLVVTAIGMYVMGKGMARRMAPALAAFALAAILSIILGVRDPLHILFFATAAMAVVSNGTYLARFFGDQWRFAGAPLTHFGFSLMLIGVLASSAYSTNQKLLLDKGETGTAYDKQVTYLGMEGAITQPKNQLILAVTDGDDVTEIHPQLYYSQRLQGIMRRPHVLSSLLADLYFAPEQVDVPDENEGMKLTRGETSEVGDLQVTFDDFVMGSHAEGGELKVAARLIISQGDQVDTVLPTVALDADAGAGGYISKVDYLFDDPTLPVELLRILADEGAIMVSLPGGTDTKPERLALDVSQKSLIGLVWAGTILMIAGVGLVFYRRRSEAPRR